MLVNTPVKTAMRQQGPVARAQPAKAKPSTGLQLGPVTLSDSMNEATLPRRIALLLWGDFGVGKSTFAATAPGKKLWLNVDPDGYTAIAHRKDILLGNVATLDNRTYHVQMQNENPLGLDEFLDAHPEVETVVFDSATAARDRALHYAVDRGVGRSIKSGFTPTIEEPGQTAYGGRNAIVLEQVSGLLRVTGIHKRHLIITAHEADPEKDDKGIVQYITMNLGGQLYTGMGYRLSEIWNLFQESTGDKNRIISVRPGRQRKPMKSRMFVQDQGSDFILDYNPDLPDERQSHTISAWYEQWVKTNAKLPLPGRDPYVQQQKKGIKK